MLSVSQMAFHATPSPFIVCCVQETNTRSMWAMPTSYYLPLIGFQGSKLDKLALITAHPNTKNKKLISTLNGGQAVGNTINIALCVICLESDSAFERSNNMGIPEASVHLYCLCYANFLWYWDFKQVTIFWKIQAQLIERTVLIRICISYCCRNIYVSI